MTFEVGKDEGATWWIPVLIFIIGLLILMLFAVGIFFLRKRKEEEDEMEMSEMGSVPSSGRRGPRTDRIDLQAEPMMDDDIAYGGPISRGGLEIEDHPEMEDDTSVIWEDTFIEFVESEDDPLISSAFDDVISRGVGRDKSRIRELRSALRRKLVEEEEDEEETFDEMNEILENEEE